MQEVFRYYVRQLPSRPVRFLARRARDAALRFIRGLAVEMNRNPYRAELRGASQMRFGHLLAPGTVDHLLHVLSRGRPNELQEIVDRASNICQHRFAILGSPLTKLGPVIDWHTDFKSGHRWPLRFHSRYRYSHLLDLDRASDVKIPWELARLQFLPLLVLAHRITGEASYANEARSLLEQWDGGNPVGFGVGWASAMEASLRAISLILAGEFAFGTPAEPKLVDPRFAERLAEHGRFIYRNLEYSDINANHHSSCLLGLLYLSVYATHDPESSRWRKLAVEGFKREVLAQTYPDGVCHEGSIPYHRFVLEIFLHAAILCRREGIDLGEAFFARLEKMFEFTMAYTKPSGRAPVWGDADDGRVHSLGSQHVNDHRYLLTVGAALYQRPDMKAASGGLWSDAVWLLGPDGVRSFDQLPARKFLARSQAFDAGGFFFLRSDNNYVAVDCGDVGLRGRGGHGHNDALNIEVCLDGSDIITDSGFLTYTASREYRRKAVSAVGHNVATVDGLEPAPLNQNRISSPTACPIRLRKWKVQGGTLSFEGEHYGYRRLSLPVTYRRHLQINSAWREIRVTDVFIGQGQHRLTWRFHLATAWDDVRLGTDGQITLHGRGAPRYVIRNLSRDLNVRLERSDYYPSYGVRLQRWCVVYECEVGLPFQATFEISCSRQ